MEELNFPKLIKLLYNHINFGKYFHSDNYITNCKNEFSWKLLKLLYHFLILFFKLFNCKREKLNVLHKILDSQHLNHRLICIIHTHPIWSRSSYLGDTTNWTSASFSRWLDLFCKREYMYIIVFIELLHSTKYNFMLHSEKKLYLIPCYFYFLQI